ncbi:crossover junction endodeoxyribonuclease RuvC [Janibacter sp. GXQ6167]|uniref:crossover junction endodeoxyribonuclease RuvC n=1 Tax=Janibacter sp. GXQ6167 TaxID=3240791 RepID=UPI00352510D8
MRVLGVDPGLTRCGLGVVDGTPAKPRMVATGVVRTTPERDTGDRLAYLQDELDAWIDRFEPDVIALERLYVAEHVPTVMTTAQASAIVLLAGSRRGLRVHLHTPTEVKAAVTGSGRAGKAQVTAMVTRILALDSPPKPADAADALALAVCHLWRGSGHDRLAAAAASERARLGAASKRKVSS